MRARVPKMEAAVKLAVCFVLSVCSGNGQETRPQTAGAGDVENPPQSLTAIMPRLSGVKREDPKPDEYVRVSINGTLGPMGYIATPSLSSATQLAGVSPEAMLASLNYNFPSIVLYISAMPVVYVPQSGQVDKIVAAPDKDGRYPEWLDATFTLIPQAGDNSEIPNACHDGSIQVLGILPQQTVAANKDSVAADTAGAVNNVAGALASFYPGVKSQVTASTSALNVLFQAIFPPKPVAYQYSYLDGNCHFGWFFRPNTTTTSGGTTVGQASILGTQTGIVLLKTDKKIKRIQLKGQTLSLWNKQATSKGDYYVGMSAPLPSFILPDESNIDYGHLADLSAFPALISGVQAMRILQICQADDTGKFDRAACIKKLTCKGAAPGCADPSKPSIWDSLTDVTQKQCLTIVPTGASVDQAYVTNASLATFLGIAKPSAQNPPPAPGPVPKPGAN